MVQHSTIDHTGITGAGGSVATDAIWDAAGDLAVGSGANTAAKLTKGTALQVLRVNSGATGLEWATPSSTAFSGAKVYNNGTQSISNNTETIVTFGAEEYDTDTYHDTGSNTGRLTAPSTAKYRVSATTAFAANATGSRVIGFRKNGSGYIRGGYMIYLPHTSIRVGANLSCDIALSATDYVELFVYQNSGGSLNLGDVDAADFWETTFSIVRLG